jgi:transcriptional regulator with XRE-family HTH domain
MRLFESSGRLQFVAVRFLTVSGTVHSEKRHQEERMDEFPDPQCVTVQLLRASRGWTQDRLAEAAGLTRSQVNEYEKGKHVPGPEVMERITVALGLPSEAAAWSLTLVRLLQAAARFSRSHPGSRAYREIESLVLRAGHGVMDFLRSWLTEIVTGTDAILDRRQAEALWPVLAKIRPEGRRAVIENGSEYQTWAMVERLCAESRSAAANSGKDALELAELARIAAGKLKGAAAQRSRASGYALAHQANALRVMAELVQAELAFAKAKKLWVEGAPGDPGFFEAAQMLSLEASLRMNQGYAKDALALLQKADALARPELKPRLLIKKANALQNLGNHQEAIELLDCATSPAAPILEPRQLLVVLFNKTVSLWALERFADAEKQLGEVCELANRQRNGLDLLRTRWLSARVRDGLGHSQEAIALLEGVREELVSRQMPHDIALVLLDLAILRKRLGQSAQVVALAHQVWAIVQAQRVPETSLAALRLFCGEVESGTLTAELARQIRDFLEQTRQVPKLTFAEFLAAAVEKPGPAPKRSAGPAKRR